MSAIVFGTQSQTTENKFNRLKRAQQQAEREQVLIRRDAPGEAVCRDTRARLEPFRVHFIVDEDNVVELACNNVRVLTLSSIHSGDPECARFARTIAIYFNYTKPVEIRLALLERPKTLAHNRSMTMDDINSGVTYRSENLIILWRYDRDFWKVFTHEMVHLTANDSDEADTEARALDLWCMYRTRSYEEYQALKREQMALSRRTAEKMLGADGGSTNAIKYFVDALSILEGKKPVGCKDCHANGGEDEELILTI